MWKWRRRDRDTEVRSRAQVRMNQGGVAAANTLQADIDRNKRVAAALRKKAKKESGG